MTDTPEEGLPEHPDPQLERRRMRIATTIFAAATFLSRLVGMAREIVVAALFGATTALSAFTIAFQIPNVIRSLVADAALSAAFVPVFTELREQEEQERAWRVASTFVWLILLVLGPLTILSMVYAPVLVQPFVGTAAFTPEEVQLTVDLARILMPIVVLMALSGLVVGILHAHDHFTTPALAPIAWNLVILLSLLVIVPMVDERWHIHVYATGVLVGTIVQLLMPVPWLRGTGGRIRLTLALRDPRVREVLILMLPVTISLGLINIQQLIDIAFATRVPEALVPTGVEHGAGPAVIDRAFRLYMLPQGMFSVAISTVFFPALARLAARGDRTGFRETFAHGLGQIFLLLLPSAALLAALSEPITRLLYERGEFTAFHTVAVSDALLAFSLGLVFNGASLLLIRSFFSLKQPWLPTIVSLLTLVVNAIADFLLYTRLGFAGIALATSIVNIVGFCALYVLLRRRVGLLHTTKTVRVFAVALFASVLAAAAALAVWSQLDPLLGRGLAGQLLSLGIASLLAGAVYLGIVVRLRLMDTDALLSMFRRNRRRDEQDGSTDG